MPVTNSDNWRGPLERWRSREPLDHKKLNQTVDAMRGLVRGVRAPAQVFPKAPPVIPFSVRRFRVESVDTDFLVCKEVDAAEDDNASVRVALPYILRRTPFETDGDGTPRELSNGKTLTYVYTTNTERVATDADDNEETQVIVPEYVEGDLVFAARGVEGGTGVFVPAVLDPYFRGDQDEVTLLDLNVDGRMWAKKDE